MVKQEILDREYMNTAFGFSRLSHARRKKVGALLVIPEGGRFEGINGMPSGFDNNCETIDSFICGEPILVTKKECLHAEANALAKVARSTQSTIGSTMYTTLSPCIECAKLMIQCGIVRVVFSEEYRDTEGISLLQKAGIQVDVLVLSQDNEIDLQDEGLQYDPEDNWRA